MTVDIEDTSSPTAQAESNTGISQIGTDTYASATTPSDSKTGPLTEKLAQEIAQKEALKVIYESQFKFTEILGVFVALFTFVSIEIQIFSKVASLANAALFSFLIFLCMIGFLFFLHLILHLQKPVYEQSQKTENVRNLILCIPLVVIIVVGYFSIAYLKTHDILLSPQENAEIEQLRERLNRNDIDIATLKELVFRNNDK